jgi:hypothetical protein
MGLAVVIEERERRSGRRVARRRMDILDFLVEGSVELMRVAGGGSDCCSMWWRLGLLDVGGEGVERREVLVPVTLN